MAVTLYTKRAFGSLLYSNYTFSRGFTSQAFSHVDLTKTDQSAAPNIDLWRQIYLSKKLLKVPTEDLALKKRDILKEVDLGLDSHMSIPFLDKMLRNFKDTIINCVLTDSSRINEIARYVLGTNSKLFRPRFGIMIARILRNDLTDHYDSLMKLLQSFEIVHAGSLIHDDVLDDAKTRRKLESVHSKFGTKCAILAGDLMLAKACVTVANLRNHDIILSIARSLENLILGELTRVKPTENCELMLETYLYKTFLKTASLMAECASSVSSLLGCTNDIRDKCYLIGLHVGMAFQIYDDILDYNSNSSLLGKPALNDISSGMITMPLLFAALEHNVLLSILTREEISPENKDEILRMVNDSKCIERCKCALLMHVNEVVSLLKILNKQKEQKYPLTSSCKALLKLVIDAVTRSKD
ncbi:bifunctional Isoprenoid synthase domain superfamily/Polyprenyl synthetase [Babesia duncani]|uniref:Bifunctional Isoprenoid synthase domain superfamily/Polyprenyl synthetase n=1 Tax=Babesia duncani TaxID=323732 RepID=A0AAD9PI40_9APIC|nr:bifunctional Isoprenoid synthase domain superfamily/Polyprenyl synthetase [Babesia duncani]